MYGSEHSETSSYAKRYATAYGCQCHREKHFRKLTCTFVRSQMTGE